MCLKLISSESLQLAKKIVDFFDTGSFLLQNICIQFVCAFKAENFINVIIILMKSHIAGLNILLTSKYDSFDVLSCLLRGMQLCIFLQALYTADYIEERPSFDKRVGASEKNEFSPSSNVSEMSKQMHNEPLHFCTFLKD